jgi:signal transduction histidine kinase/CheY-like chemotaxis protein
MRLIRKRCIHGKFYMSEPNDELFERPVLRPLMNARARWASRACALVVVVLTSSILLGWATDNRELETLGTGLPAMRANGAIACALCAVALWIGYLGPLRRWSRPVTFSIAGAVAGGAFLTLLEYWTGRSFGIDQLFIRDPHPLPGIVPGRITPSACVGLVFLSAGLFFLSRGNRGALGAQILVLATLFIALLNALGIMFDVGGFVSMFSFHKTAIPGLISFFLLGCAMLLARPRKALVASILADNPGGIVSRRLILPTIFIPILFGGIAYHGHVAGEYGEGATCLLIVLSSVVVGSAVILRSVSELNGIENARRKLLEARLHSDVREQGALEASRLKSEFVANVSHELRTPMNGVLGMTNLLLGSPLNADQREQVETIRQSGDALLTLVNEILDFSKIEAGKVQLEYKKLHLAPCIDDVLSLLAPMARRGRINLISFIDPQLPTTFLADEARLRQILINLVGNAIKFTSEGEVVVEISGEAGHDEIYRVDFYISDTGIGIAEEALPQLFQPFKQVDASSSRRHGGTGLGLAISKRLTELMGGDMEVSSVLGAGSTFRFSVPLQSVAGEPGDEQMPSGTRVALAVKHGGRYAEVLEKQLKAWGGDVLAPPDPVSILHREGNRFASVVLDRDEQTLQLVEAMQDDPAWKALPKILLDFGEPLSDEQAAWFTKRLSKPIKRHHLQAFLLECTGNQLTRTKSRVTLPLQAMPLAQEIPLRILLAEDNHINQKVAVALLARFGYRVDVAGNGMEAFESVMRQTYDIVFLDIQMPEMDGIQAAHAIRERLRERCPKLVALTANAFPGAREQYLGEGFDEYLSKPLIPDLMRELLVRVSERTAAA